MNVNTKITYRKLYIGLELLRIFFSFNILVLHCINRKIYTKLLNIVKEIVSLGLITFFIMSFYFSYELFSSKNIIKIKQRFQRLLIPYIVWPIFMFIHKNNILYLLLYKKTYIAKYIFYQFLIGNGIYSVFWFSYNLIFASLILTIIIFITKKNLIILLTTSIFIYLYISSGYYYKIFLNFNWLWYYSIRPLAYTYILMTIGSYLSSIKIIEKSNANQKYSIIFCLILLILLIIFYKIIRKYLFLLYLFSISLIILFSILPFSKLKFTANIKQISSYTGGIYYTHVLVYSLIKKYVIIKYNIVEGTIIICIINYLLCFIICFIGFKIFKKNKLKYLFI